MQSERVASPFRTRDGNLIPSARAWEESLGNLELISNQNLEKLAEIQRDRQPTPHDRSFPFQLTSRSQSYRSQSTPRQKNSLQSSLEHNSMSKDALRISCNQEIVPDRKLDFMMKKIRDIEEKIKKTEKDQVSTNNSANRNYFSVEDLVETQKTDKKNIFCLKDTVAALKCQMDVLQHRDDVREKALQRPVPGQLQTIDVDAIKEVVLQRVQADFNKVVQEVVKVCASEQASYLSKWSEKEKLEREKAFRGGQAGASVVAGMEKEMARIISDMTRLKSRQDALEVSHSELHTSVCSREKIAEEQHRHVVSNYRTDMQIMVDSIGSKINQQLQVLQLEDEANKRVIDELALAQDHSIERLGAQLQLLEESLISTQMIVNKREDVYIDSKCYPESKENEIEKEMMDNVQSLQSSLERLSEATVNTTAVLDTKIQTISTALRVETENRHQGMSQLMELSKRTRSKVREITSQNKGISSFRNSLDNILNRISVKEEDESIRYYSLHDALQVMADRVLVVEAQFDQFSFANRDVLSHRFDTTTTCSDSPSTKSFVDPTSKMSLERKIDTLSSSVSILERRQYQREKEFDKRMDREKKRVDLLVAEVNHLVRELRQWKQNPETEVFDSQLFLISKKLDQVSDMESFMNIFNHFFFRNLVCNQFWITIQLLLHSTSWIPATIESTLFLANLILKSDQALWTTATISLTNLQLFVL